MTTRSPSLDMNKYVVVRGCSGNGDYLTDLLQRAGLEGIQPNAKFGEFI